MQPRNRWTIQFDHLPSDEPSPDHDPPPPGREDPDDEDPLHPRPDEIKEPRAGGSPPEPVAETAEIDPALADALERLADRVESLAERLEAGAARH